MDLGYVTVNSDSTFAEVVDRIRRFEERRNKFPTVLVVEGEKLVGNCHQQTYLPDEKCENIYK